jgi:predicted lipid-binding transport protein (Tim44 family)
MMAIAVLAMMPMTVSDADARLGGGKSWGSRGSRTYNQVPSTSTAPGTAPVTRSYTQPGSTATNPGVGAAAGAAQQGSRFGGFGRLLLGGLLGAGLFGLLSGSGLFGGLSGFAGFLGLLLQVALIGGLVWLVWSFFRNRQGQPTMASQGATPGYGGNPGQYPDGTMTRDGYGNPPYAGGQGGGSYGGGFGQGSGAPLQIQQADYEAFERALVDLQLAYGKADFNRLAELATPEMLAYFSEDFRENQRNGVRNEIGSVKFIKGDLAEAWTERDQDYATVAIKYAITDAMVDVNSGRVVEGDLTHPQEVTEVWTFTRNHRDLARGWIVSAIQQTDDGARA